MESAKHAIVLCCVFFSTLISCTTQTLDFNQANDLIAEPEIEASIIYVEVPERVINLVEDRDFFSQDFNFDAFSSDIFADRVIEGTVTYVIENTTSKQLEITIEFLDEAGTVLDTEFFTIPQAPTATLQREIFYGASGRSIDIIKNTSSIRVSAINFGGTATTSTFPNPIVTLKSSGKFKVSLI